MRPQPLIPKTLYKFLPRKYVRAFKKTGSLRVGTLHDFRRSEHGSEIGDAEEGSIRLRSRDEQVVYDSENLTPDLEWQRPYIEEKFGDIGIKIVASGGMHQHVSVNDCYVFCTGTVFDWSTIDEPSYNACIRIDNPVSFCDAIVREIRGIEPGFHYGTVAYHQKSTYGHSYPGYHPALVKDPAYAHQKEFRYMFQPSEPTIAIMPIFIEARGARKYCSFIGL